MNPHQKALAISATRQKRASVWSMSACEDHKTTEILDLSDKKRCHTCLQQSSCEIWCWRHVLLELLLLLLVKFQLHEIVPCRVSYSESFGFICINSGGAGGPPGSLPLFFPTKPRQKSEKLNVQTFLYRNTHEHLSPHAHIKQCCIPVKRKTHTYTPHVNVSSIPTSKSTSRLINVGTMNVKAAFSRT